MSDSRNQKFLSIALCFALGSILFSFNSCSNDRSSADRPVSLMIGALDTYPSWSPDGTRIVFESNRAGSIDIYAMNADGSDQIRLTDNLSDDENSAWAPDGTRIVFDSDREGNRDIYAMQADGSDQSRLTDNPARDGGASWSPDGTRIAFHSNRDGNREIYSMNADGSDQIRLTDNPANDVWPSWSPDGQKISFISGRDGNAEIYTMNADGSDPTRLTDNPARDGMAAWSPDNTRIIFISNRDGNPEIYTMNADGSDQTRLTNEPFGEAFPSWSPDGRKILFSSNRDIDLEVYVMDADGSNQTNLTNNAPVNGASGLVPLPRSELNLEEIPYRIVFESYRETEGKKNWELCLIDADGSNLINLTNTPESDEMYPHASPDGSLVCFVADEGEDKENKSRNVYIMNIDGTGRIKIAEHAYQPCWSPDGRHIAYLPGEYPRYDRLMWANKGLEIYDIETKEVKRHPNEELSHLFNLCWSPDGEWFTAAGRRGPNIAFKADDKTKKALLAAGCRPDISPDGKRIGWHGTDWSINIGRLDFDSPQSNVTDHTIVVACERDHKIYHVDWSPDGNYLTFSYWPNDGDEAVSFPAPGANICICDLSSGKWIQITTDGKHNKEPDWVPVQIRRP
jgi:Tol biopolymer transport system component